MGVICPICGSGKFLTEQKFYSAEDSTKCIITAIECNNDNCSWVGEADELDDGDNDE